MGNIKSARNMVSRGEPKHPATAVIPLWPEENTAPLIEHIHNHRQEFVKSNVLKACADAAPFLPNNPRTGEKYLGQEIRKKLGYLKKKECSWDDLARDGKTCLSWRPSQEKSTEIKINTGPGTTTEGPTSSCGNTIGSKPSRSGHLPPLPRSCHGDVTSQPPTPNHSTADRQYHIPSTYQSQSVMQDNHEYLTSTARRHVIFDDRVKGGMRKILHQIRQVVTCISETLDFSTMPYPQFDAIEVRCPTTSMLLHKALGLSEKGPLSLNHKLGKLGLGRLSFTDWLHSLIGAAIHNWIFRTEFPTSLTRPDKSLRMLNDILDEKGLKHLKENLLYDIRCRNLEVQRPEFQNIAATLAAKLGAAIEPMLVRHDLADPHIGGPNVDQVGEVWERWHTQMTTMWLECLEFKASIVLDPEFFSFQWPKAGVNFEHKSMEHSEDRQALDGRPIYVAILPAIIAPDREHLVLSKAIIVQ